MIKLLRLTDEQRRLVFTNAGFNAGLLPNVVEKDWWVTVVLKAVFQTEYAPHLLFKGGTSLSKCWKLIDRFSEDIDLAIDRTYLGFAGNISNSKIHELKKTACRFTSNQLQLAIETQLRNLEIPDGILQIAHKEIDPQLQDRDPQEIIITYPSLFEPVDYIPSHVKVEVSGLSLMDPFIECYIQSIVDEQYPDQSFTEKSFKVRAVHPKRTFIEKIFLLHEEFQRGKRMRSHRMSRHLYDIEAVMDSLYGWDAILDSQLYSEVIDHRKKFNKLSGIDYDLHKSDTVNFLPHPEIIKGYEEDYLIMRTRMIGGNPPSFALLIKRLEELISRFRKPRHFVNRDIKSVVEAARERDAGDSRSSNFMIEGAEITIQVDYDDFTYEVLFERRNGLLLEKKIRVLSEKINNA